MKNRIFWIIVLLAIIIRLLYFFQIKDHFLFKQPILDAKYYHTWALEIAGGDWLGKSRGVFMMSPGYSYFLGAIYRVFGPNIPFVVLFQFLLSVLTGLIIFKIGEKLFSRTAGVLGMSFYLFYSISIFYESTLLKTTLINFVNMLGIYLIIAGGLVNCLVSGILLGFSVHLRPNILIFLPFAGLYILKDKKFKPSLVFILGVLLILFPVAWRNLKVGGEFVFSTAHGGMNFYTGNSSFCKGPYTPLPFARTDPEVEQSDFMQEANRRSGLNLTPAQSSSFWYKESFKYIENHFSEWFNLVAKKTLIFINSYEPPINLDYYFFKNEYKSILSVPMLGFGIVLPLAVIGLIFSPYNFLLLAYLLVYFASSVIFFVVSEYRFPIVPVLCVYAGFGIGYLINLYRKGSPLKLYLTFFMLIFLFWLVNKDIYSDVFGFPKYKRANLANSYFGLGVTYEDQGLVKEAVETYKKAIDIMPQSGPMVNLANIYEKQGDLDGAQKIYEAAIRNNPNSSEAFNNLGSVLFKKGKYEDSIKCFKQALMLNPYFEQAGKNLAILEDVIKKKSK
ncbi:MAG: tetratricopeptide repeat protein [Elusimicrobia bacterium]|nr:tetratricopeptide repeat protein [Candidatus Liberimonas magnetica]